MTDQAWWMIERTDLEPSPHYFAWKYRPEQLPPHGSHTWTPDWQLGERFPTKEAAEAHTNSDPNLRVCDHCMMQTDPIGTAQERELIEALDNIKFGLDFAYEQGLHEFGYDPVASVRDALQSRIAEVGRLTELIEELVSKAYERGWNEGCETMLDANEIDGAILYPHKDARNEGCGTYMNEVRAALSLQRRV